MKILNKIVEFIKSLISKVRKPVHAETPVTSEKKVENVETVEKKVEVPVTSEKKVETPVKQVKRRGRPRKVKSEWTIIDLKKSITAI